MISIRKMWGDCRAILLLLILFAVPLAHSAALAFNSFAASNPFIDFGQNQTLTAVWTGGNTPYSANFLVYANGVLVYNALYTSIGGTNNAITFTQQAAWAAGPFTANVAITDSSGAKIANSITYNSNSVLTAPPTPVASSPLAGYNGVVQITSDIPTTGSSPYVYTWLVSYNFSAFYPDYLDSPLGLTYCGAAYNSSYGAVIQAGNAVTCSFSVINSIATPPGYYTFELQVFDNATITETTVSNSVTVTVGNALLAQQPDHIIFGQNETYSIFIANSMAPFYGSPGPYNVVLTGSGLSSVPTITVNSMAFNSATLTLAKSFNFSTFDYPGNFTVSAVVTDASTGNYVTTPSILTKVHGNVSATTPVFSDSPVIVGSPTVVSTTLYGGVGPFVANFVFANGILADSVAGIPLDGTATYAFAPAAAGMYTFNVVVTDTGTTPQYTTSTAQASVNAIVLSYQPTGIIAWLPITLTNYQSTAVAANTPIAIGTTSSGNVIGFNALKYSQYYTCDLNNAEFFFQNGSIATSWMEGNMINENTANAACTSSGSRNALVNSANILYWIRVPSNTFLPANTGSPTTNIIYLGWAGNTISQANTLLNTLTTGEAPQFSITGYANSIQHITSTTAISNGIGGVKPQPPNFFAPLYLCAIAINSNIYGGGFGGDRFSGEGFVRDAQDTNGITVVGDGSQNNCFAGSLNSIDTMAGAGMSLEVTDMPYMLYAKSTTALATATGLTFNVLTANAFVVIGFACGYSACDNTPQAQGTGGTGSVVVPPGCNLVAGSDYDGYENASFYTCNSLIPGSYTANALNNGHFGGAAMSIAAYVFQNVTTIPVNYAEYDNGANLFGFYDNFAGNTLSTKWSLNSCQSSALLLNDGITFPPLTSTCQLTAPSVNLTGPYIVDVYQTPQNIGYGRFGFINFVATANFIYDWLYPNMVLPWTGNGVTYTEGTAFTAPAGGNVSTIMTTNAVAKFYANYRLGNTITATMPVYSSYLIYYLGTNQQTTISYQWTRSRVYPPNGVLPSTTFGSVVLPASANSLMPSNSVINFGGGVTFNVIVSGGAGPFTLRLTYSDGTTANTLSGAHDGINTFGSVIPQYTPAIYNVIGTDTGTTPYFTFASTSNSVTVIGAPASTTTTSTVTTTIATTTIQGGGNPGTPGGPGGPTGTGGSLKPTATLSGSCYSITNMTALKGTNVTLDGMFIEIVTNFIGPTSAGVTVNNVSYTLTQGAAPLPFSISGINYTIGLTTVTYLPILHTIEVKVCTTTASPINSAYGTLIINNSGTFSTVSINSNSVTANLGFWPGKITFSLPENMSNTIYLHISNATLSALEAPQGYTKIVAINLSIDPAAGVGALATLGYSCSIDSTTIAPFIVANGVWNPITPFTADPHSCTLSFAVPLDPVIGLMVKNQTATVSTTTINQSGPGQKPTSGISLYVIVGAVAVVAVIVVLFLAYRIRKGKPTVAPPHNDSPQHDQPVPISPAEPGAGGQPIEDNTQNAPE